MNAVLDKIIFLDNIPVKEANLGLPVETISATHRAAAMLDPVRLRILECVRDEADSAAGVARALGMGRQRINYHVRELEKAGLLEAVGERKRGNFVERLVRAKARAWVIAPQVLGGMAANAEDIRDRFSTSYLLALAARSIRDVSDLREQAEAAGKRVASFTLETEARFASPVDANAFMEDLSNCMATLVAKYHDEHAPAGRTFRFNVMAYPGGSGTAPHPEGRETAGEES
jgi:DNA-binding transcriptional ArsR family regulator